MTNLDSILKSRDTSLLGLLAKIKCKSRDITLPTKVHLAKAVVFPVVIRMEVRVGL